MLKHIPMCMNADLLWVLAAMGHGDDLAIVDRNFPAYSSSLSTQSGKLITLAGTNAPDAIASILELLPLDTFVEAPLMWMDPVDRPGDVLSVHSDVADVCNKAEGRLVAHSALERHQFYTTAKKCFAIVQTIENRPYGCFILKKGVIFER